jgi:ribosome-associated toxin RatA of RatAB toxin-antitoxin module
VLEIGNMLRVSQVFATTPHGDGRERPIERMLGAAPENGGVMAWSRLADLLVLMLALLSIPACSKQPTIDWAAPEDFFATEKSEEVPDGARLEFHSLVDAPAADVYRTVADVEDYARFIDGVSESALLSKDSNTKVIRITQTVIGRQNRAEVKWTLHPEQMQIEFETLKSDGNYNAGSYKIIPSPDNKRAYIISVYHVMEKGAPQNVPIGVLKSATREAFAKAARSVKQAALAMQGH